MAQIIRLTLNLRIPLLLALLFTVSSFSARAATAAITILSPDDGTVVEADPCPFSICTGEFPFEVRVTGAPMDRVEVHLMNDDTPAFSFVQPLCLTDPIENESCPNPPRTFTRDISLGEGEWTVNAKVIRGNNVETTPDIHLTVLPPNVTPPDAVRLAAVEPNQGSTAIVVREANNGDPGESTTPTRVDIIGENLHDNLFIEVYLAPKPVNEPTFTEESALPTQDWCLFKAEIKNRGTTSEGDSFLTVEIPELPLETPSLCGISPGPSGSIFTQEWRWLIRDRWIRPEREHEWWAIPSPREGVAWQDAPPFKLVKATYPKIHGFGFDNFETDPRYYEFLTVYGNNAYLCVGAFGICATRLPDPLYHLLWWPIYLKAIGSTGGSCNGMASTSLLFAREEMQTESFNTRVLYPAGFDDGGDPATYSDTNFCTPVCSPPKPKNLWATIRMNHGVQISREFLFEIIDTLGEAIFDPNDLTSIKGVPNATLERVRANPQGFVICFFKPGNGHCVTPYRVDGNKIMIYDNNNPRSDTRFIEIAGGDYNYPQRSDEPNSGNAIMAFPISIWEDDRHLLGLSDFALDFNGDIVDFLYMIAVGSGDMTVTNAAGGRWGWEENGSFTDQFMGAVAVAPLGPQAEESRAMPLLVAMNQPAPLVQINADGGNYSFHSGAGGHLLQLEANAQAGDQDQIQLGYDARLLASMHFTPEQTSTAVVPRVGLAIGEEESALFHWLGLTVPGGRSVAFGADKTARAVSYRNETGGPTHHVLALDYGSGEGESYGRMVYGPFDVPAGAHQRIVLANWPEVNEVIAELDLDGDGTVDETSTVTGRPGEMPLAQGTNADLMVAQAVSQPRVLPDEGVVVTTTVMNMGPAAATGVTLVDALPASVALSTPMTTTGTCATDDDGLRCDLGTLAANASVTVSYVATPTVLGTLTSGAFVFGSEGDPDPTNNSAVVTVRVGNVQETILLPRLGK